MVRKFCSVEIPFLRTSGTIEMMAVSWHSSMFATEKIVRCFRSRASRLWVCSLALWLLYLLPTLSAVLNFCLFYERIYISLNLSSYSPSQLPLVFLLAPSLLRPARILSLPCDFCWVTFNQLRVLRSGDIIWKFGSRDFQQCQVGFLEDVVAYRLTCPTWPLSPHCFEVGARLYFTWFTHFEATAKRSDSTGEAMHNVHDKHG